MSLPILNLLNFEIPSANKCRYVLTSPRSLKACRKAGIKPIELLYKSASLLEREAGKREDGQILFQAYEKERQRKLTLCRLIRNELLLYGYTSMKDRGHKPESVKKFSPKLQDVKERALPIIRECYLRKRAETPENIRNIKDQSSDEVEKYLNLPKVNITHNIKLTTRYTENKSDEEIKSFEKIYDSELKNKSNSILSEISRNEIDNTLKYRREEVLPKNITKEECTEKKYIATGPVIYPQIDEGKEIQEVDKKKLVLSENFDFANYDAKFKAKRTNSAHRRKTKESKKKSKASEQKKLIQNMKIQYSDPEYCMYKYKQVIENSVDRELKEIEVHRVQRELDEGMEKWQDRVLLLQWLDVNRAREQALRELEMKVERLQQKSRAKCIIHMMNINKVKEAEEMKAEGLRKQVEKKDRKINTLHQEKEKIISESKARAISIQDLKDQMRNIMTPETFDQKVSRLGMHKRVLGSQMCSRVMQTSHIWLG